MSNTVHSILRTLCWSLIPLVAAWAGGAEIPSSIQSSLETSTNRVSTPHPLVWDAMVKQINPTGMIRVVSFTFSVTNISSAEAVIRDTITSCDCAVAEMPSKPWVLKPGAGGSLKVNLTTLGRFGLVTKLIGIETSHGPQLLTVRSEIPLSPAPFNVSGRERDRMTAQADPQSIFKKTECAACHALPAAGRMGEPLFTKACAICHISDHRAAMVPDLATLNHAINADYWRTIITRGKAGSLMPAFAKSEGGILDSEQIESLVEYLIKAYPAKGAISPKR
jgi:cytochrome c553